MVMVGWGCGTSWTSGTGAFIHTGHGVLATVMVHLVYVFGVFLYQEQCGV